MADLYRTDGSHALDSGTAGDRDAKIEQLLLSGLDHYFAAQYEQAVNVWTRALFLDRNHARARAYIERARSALAERQRRSEELLQSGMAAFERGDGTEARRLLRAAIDGGAPADEAFTVLNRLDRLERAEAPVVATRSDGARRAPGRPASNADASVEHHSRSGPLVGIGLIVVLVALAGSIASVAGWWSWSSLANVARPRMVTTAEPAPPTLDLPVPRRGEMELARARDLAAGGRLHDALEALDRIRPTDAERGEADRLRAQIQDDLLALALPPDAAFQASAGAEGTGP